MQYVGITHTVPDPDPTFEIIPDADKKNSDPTITSNICLRAKATK